MNYGQLTSLFRVEQRSTSYVIASVANVLITIGSTILLVVVFHEGALGVIVGNFLGTLTVYLGLLAYRREQLGLQFDWELFKKMEQFGLPLLPSALALWAINFSDRFFLTRLSGTAETGIYQIGVQVASVIVFLLMAFRLAWPAFAYSIEDDREAKRTYPFVLTYLIFICSWLSLALGLLAPWIVRLLTTPQFYEGAQVVALLAFAATAYAGYAVVVIGVGRARQTRFNWIVTGAAAVLNVGLNLWLIPEYGQIGAGIATAAAYSLMFVGMTWNAHRLFPVPYQWRRVVTVAGIAVGLTVLGKELDVSLGVAIALVAVYPLLLALAGFYLPAERRMLKRGCCLARLGEQSGQVHDREPGHEPADDVRRAQPAGRCAGDVATDFDHDLERCARRGGEEEDPEEVAAREAADPRSGDRGRAGDQREHGCPPEADRALRAPPARRCRFPR